MSQSAIEAPTVCAIMLTADRPHLARRAVESFRSQTYPAKRLLVFDTGDGALHDLDIGDGDAPEWYAQRGKLDGARTIGELRNLAAGFPMAVNADILIHWDDDDWSHPNRIAEQVTLLQSSGADCVGYNSMLFWRQDQNGMDALSEAWMFRQPAPNYALGTSLCYWRKVWERNPFKATSRGEDLDFCRALKCVGVPANPSDFRPEPRMIARIHGGNTMMGASYTPEKMREAPDQWRRVPGWDAYAGSVME